jgi:hypothetical protein
MLAPTRDKLELELLWKIYFTPYKILFLFNTSHCHTEMRKTDNKTRQYTELPVILRKLIYIPVYQNLKSCSLFLNLKIILSVTEGAFSLPINSARSYHAMNKFI